MNTEQKCSSFGEEKNPPKQTNNNQKKNPKPKTHHHNKLKKKPKNQKEDGRDGKTQSRQLTMTTVFIAAMSKAKVLLSRPEKSSCTTVKVISISC